MGDPSVQTASAISNSWCVATTGICHVTNGAAQAKPTRPMSQERTQQRPSWHRNREAKIEALTCAWPPKASPLRRALGWSAVLQVGDTLGLLVTPYGGLAMLVNGERVLLIPDARVPSDQDLYPLFEAYNHVRSVQLV